MRKIHVDWTDEETLQTSLYEYVPTIEQMLEELLRKPCKLREILTDPSQIRLSKASIRWDHDGPLLAELIETIDKCADIVAKSDAPLAEEIRRIDAADLEGDADAEFDFQRKIKWLVATSESPKLAEDARAAIKYMIRQIRARFNYTPVFGVYDPNRKVFTLHESILNWSIINNVDQAERALVTFANLCFQAQVYAEANEQDLAFECEGDNAAIEAMGAYFESMVCRQLGLLYLSGTIESAWEFRCSETWEASLAYPMLKCDRGSGNILRDVYGKLFMKDYAYDLVKACKVMWES